MNLIVIVEQVCYFNSLISMFSPDKHTHSRPTERGSKNSDLALLGKIKLQKRSTVELLEFSEPVKAI